MELCKEENEFHLYDNVAQVEKPLDELDIHSSGDAIAQFSENLAGNIIMNNDDRVIRRAKRSSKDDKNACQTLVNGITHGKTCGNSQSRRSRKGKARPGHSKKSGAGGKGVWGFLSSELDASADVGDIHDPNYDSDSQGEYKLVQLAPKLTDEELENIIKPIIHEYLEHGNTAEVEDLLRDLNLLSSGFKITKLAILVGLDRHNAQRELISQLISDLSNNLLSTGDIANAFDELLKSMEDLRLDIPDAPNLLGQFMARCIADDCLPPKFITNYKGKVDNKFVKDSLEKANVLITMKQGMVHLDTIWGVGGSNRPVKYLTNKMILLLKEYLSSGDLDEALRCLKELEVPHFHHELVYQVCDIAIEASTDATINAMVKLLKYLTAQTGVITIDQFEKGVLRVCDDIHDISLDVPNAFQLLDSIATKLHVEGMLSDKLYAELPARGRKRFVSEGDGGLLKPKP